MRYASICAVLGLVMGLSVPGTGLQAQQLPEKRAGSTASSVPSKPSPVTLTRDILFQVLVGEFSLQRGYFDEAAQVFIELAERTRDPRLAKRGFQAAMASRDMMLARRGAQIWSELDPKDSEAVASALALAATDGQTSGLTKALRQRLREADDKEQAVIHAYGIVAQLQDQQAAREILESVLRGSVRELAVSQMALSDAAWETSDAKAALAYAQAALKADATSEAAAQRILEYGFEVDPAVALAETKKWLGQHPDARKAHLMYISRLVQRKAYEEALAHLAQMRERSPEDFDLLYTEAEVHVHAENFDEARSLLNEYIAVQTQRRASLDDRQTNALADAAEAHLLLVRIAEQQGHYDEAIAELDRINEPSLQFQVALHKAVVLGEQGKLTDAQETLAALEPDNDRQKAVIAMTQASVYRKAGRTDDAVILLEDANKALPDTPEIKYDLAMLYERQGRSDKSEFLLREVIDIEPDNAHAYNALGYTFADQNRRLDEAEELLEIALELDPDNPYILDSVGWYFYRVADYDTALEYLYRSFEKMPSAEVGAHLGEVLWVRRSKKEAEGIWRKALEIDADNETLQETLRRFGVDLQ